MKKYIILSVVIAFATTSNLMGQVIVKVKPQRQKVIVVKPKKVCSNKVWVDGHWRLNKRTHNYYWVRGRWVKR